MFKHVGRSIFRGRRTAGRLSFAVALISVCLPSAIFLNCSGLKFHSRWRDRDIVVDGVYNEWEGALMYSEDQRATVGFINDDEYLYLCLLSADEQVLMRAMAAGFTVWFEGSGKKDERLNVKFPLGGTMPRRENFQPGENERADRIAEFLRDQSGIVLAQAGRNEKLDFSDLDDYGLEAKIGEHLGRMVYEIRVPLHGSKDFPYAINARAGKPIKVGFELGKMKMPERERRPRGDFRMGGGGPVGMGRGRPPGGGRGFERPKEFKFEVSVYLANKPGDSE